MPKRIENLLSLKTHWKAPIGIPLCGTAKRRREILFASEPRDIECAQCKRAYQGIKNIQLAV
jgi:hypothetical protein